MNLLVHLCSFKNQSIQLDLLCMFRLTSLCSLSWLMSKWQSILIHMAVLSFCQQTAACIDKESLLQNLRDKIEARKLSSKSAKTLHGKACVFPTDNNSLARHKNVSAKKPSIRIEIGWLHFCCNGYQQVRTSTGGGTRHVTVQKETTVLQIMQMGKNHLIPQMGI